MKSFLNFYRRDEATMRPKHEFIPKKLEDIIHLEHDDSVNGASSTFHIPTPRPKSVPVTSSLNENIHSSKNGTHSSFHSNTPYSQSLLDISPPSTVAPALPSFTPTFSSHMPAPTPSLNNYDPFDPWATPSIHTPHVQGLNSRPYAQTRGVIGGKVLFVVDGFMKWRPNLSLVSVVGFLKLTCLLTSPWFCLW